MILILRFGNFFFQIQAKTHALVNPLHSNGQFGRKKNVLNLGHNMSFWNSEFCSWFWSIHTACYLNFLWVRWSCIKTWWTVMNKRGKCLIIWGADFATKLIVSLYLLYVVLPYIRRLMRPSVFSGILFFSLCNTNSCLSFVWNNLPWGYCPGTLFVSVPFEYSMNVTCQVWKPQESFHFACKVHDQNSLWPIMSIVMGTWDHSDKVFDN